MKSTTILIAVILILSPLTLYGYELSRESGNNDSLSYNEALSRLDGIQIERNVTNKLFILDISPSDPDFQAELTLAASLTPLFVQSGADPVTINPVIVGTDEKGVKILSDLTNREVVTIGNESLNSGLYTTYYSRTSAAFLVQNYTQALAVSPAAALTGAPVFMESDPGIKETMKALGVKFVVSVGKTNVPDGMEHTRLSCKKMNDFYLSLLERKALSTDYIVVTNPNDFKDYKNRMQEGKLPVVGLSLLSAELAAYHRAPLLFSRGLPDFGKQFGDGFTQLGASRELTNSIANITLSRVKAGVSLLENHSMTAHYLALVGGPVTLPFYYENIMAYTKERQYTPTDYYFGNLNNDPKQELAVGRIFARSLTDASLMLVRSLDFNEVKDYPYPKDDSSLIYDTVSGDWKQNSMIAIGTTKIGPAPGILTPTLANQTKTMNDAGYTVTSLGYDAAQAQVVAEIIDEMNYAVYYGHGNYDCWYSAVENPVDADTINAVDLKPGFAIAMACLTGMTDNASIPLDQYVSLAFLHSGFTGYIGAIRVAYGLYDYEMREDGVIRGTGALYLVDVFSEKVCDLDLNVGEALRLAKNALIEKQGWNYSSNNDPGFEAQITVYEYVLYGDPANNLYVPVHDG